MGTLVAEPTASRLWLVGWSGLVAAALVIGSLRALVTQPLVGETAARQLATILLLGLLFSYQWWLSRLAPIPTRRQALFIGAAWMSMTLVFELSFGRFVEHLDWSTLLADYDVTNGRIWVLVPMWLLVGPATIRSWTSRKEGTRS